MKSIIITENQFKKINEVELAIKATDNTLPSFADAFKNNKTAIDKARMATNGDVEAVISGPNQREDLPPAVANVGVNQDPSQQIQKIDPSYINNGGSVKVDGPGFGSVDESRFTKSDLEKMRVANIKKDGYKYTKGKLMELFEDDSVAGLPEEIVSDELNFQELKEKTANIYNALKEYENYINGIEDDTISTKGASVQLQSRYMFGDGDGENDWNASDKKELADQVQQLGRDISRINIHISDILEMLDYLKLN